ncbi:MAG: NADH-quinone oxidoreductase subunit A [Deltaproteobacteria bacterium]|nr:NADH-quinone oxidoreductase subunit A [Deltaproteobacteria bacterium]
MEEYGKILLLFTFGALFVAAFLLVSHLIGKKKFTREKHLPYECGVDSVENLRSHFSVKFYLVAMLFILFDVEVVFLYPWAVLFKDFIARGEGLFIFLEMLIFLFILAVGLVYIYGRRALDWE